MQIGPIGLILFLNSDTILSGSFRCDRSSAPVVTSRETIVAMSILAIVNNKQQRERARAQVVARSLVAFYCFREFRETLWYP
jgi:hypothetical protein